MGGTDTGPTVLDRLAVWLLEPDIFTPGATAHPQTAACDGKGIGGETYYEMENSAR